MNNVQSLCMWYCIYTYSKSSLNKYNKTQIKKHRFILLNYVNRYGNVFKTCILGSNVIVSTDPDVNKVVLQNQANNFVPAYPKSIRELMGEQSILKMNGTMHKKVHTLIAGFLRSPQLKARITRDIEHAVKQCFASWTPHQPIYVQDQVKKVSSLFFINFYLLHFFLFRPFNYLFFVYN